LSGRDVLPQVEPATSREQAICTKAYDTFGEPCTVIDSDFVIPGKLHWSEDDVGCTATEMIPRVIRVDA